MEVNAIRVWGRFAEQVQALFNALEYGPGTLAGGRWQGEASTGELLKGQKCVYHHYIYING